MSAWNRLQRYPSPTHGDEDRDLSHLLSGRIYEFNVEATGLGDGRGMSIRAADDTGNFVAGLTGWTGGECGYVDVLWVAEPNRRQGIGTQLMAAAEAEAVTRGCTSMVLSTHSFQAPDFYRRRGYEEVGETPDYPRGHAQIHLRKQLDPH